MTLQNKKNYLSLLKLSGIWAVAMKYKQISILSAIFVCSAIALFSFASFLEQQTEGWMQELEIKDLGAQADTIAHTLEKLAIRPTRESTNQFIGDIGRNQDFRVTIINTAGTVLADSWLGIEEVKTIDGFAGRPEIRSASLFKFGQSVRHSSTMDKRLMYVAKRYEGHYFSGYIRIATPTSIIEKDLAILHDELMKIIFVVFVVFLGVNYYVYQYIKRERDLLGEQQKTLDCLNKQSENSELIQKFSQALTTCESRDELVGIISSMCGHLFGEHTFGALAVSPPSLDTIEVIATWGGVWPGDERFQPRDCWGFRRGGVHLSKKEGMEISCNHLDLEDGHAVQCVLLQSQGISLGALHIGASEETFNSNSFQNKIYTITEQLCLTISNLNLRVKLEQQAIRDPLTTLYNRRYLDDSFSRELTRAERRNSEMAVMMIDIDHFKVFNDTYGHDAGDYVIKKFGHLLANMVRGEDISCRYGGEEFTLVLNEINQQSAAKRAQALLEATRDLELQLHSQSLGQITISVGVAMYPQHGKTQSELIKAADEALYHAKEGGRDQFKIAGNQIIQATKAA